MFKATKSYVLTTMDGGFHRAFLAKLSRFSRKKQTGCADRQASHSVCCLLKHGFRRNGDIRWYTQRTGTWTREKPSQLLESTGVDSYFVWTMNRNRSCLDIKGYPWVIICYNILERVIIFYNIYIYIIYIKTWSLLIMINIIMSGGYLSVLGGLKKSDWISTIPAGFHVKTFV